MNISSNKWYLGLLLAPLLTLGLQGCSDSDSTTLDPANSSINLSTLKTSLDAIPPGTLTTAETDGILYIREEEKLARDTYQYLDAIWGQQVRVFSNITNSEQTHMDSMLLLIDRYSLTDPVGANPSGTFTDITLQNLYNTLTAQGQGDLINALKVGALIEEVDLVDIEKDLASVDADNPDIVLVYENLMKGSRNHLRAFVSNLAKQGITYAPVYLDQTVYDNIINSPMER